MHKVEPVKRLFENATGIGVPTPQAALSFIRKVKPRHMKFKDDGYIPNNPSLPLLLYRKAIQFDRRYDPAALIEAIFKANSWGNAWRNGVYDFVHYHSRIHEVLGVARGAAKLRLGGNKGVTMDVSAGDVIVIPAGVGHECLTANGKFLVVGAYPPNGTYNECRGSFQERDKAIVSIRRLSVPKKSPLYGAALNAWR
jgi:uncharacterized protein YjlB